jgi:hypothetical protein
VGKCADEKNVDDGFEMLAETKGKRKNESKGKSEL